MDKTYWIEVTYKCVEILDAESREEALDFVKNKYREEYNIILSEDEMEVVGEDEDE